MRIAAAFLFLAGVAAPALAQPASPGELRQDRREIRQDRGEGFRQRQEVRGDVARGDYREAARDRGELRQDRRELRDDRRELRDDRRGDQPGFADRRDDRRDFRDDRRDDRGDWRRDGRPGVAGRPGFDRPGFAGRPGDRPGFDDRNGWNGRGGAWSNGWRGDNRYDWQRYRSANRRFYTLPRYYAPSGFGYGYRRFGVGLRLGQPFFADRYWISDPWAYRLPPAYGPYRWVRYYDDVLLVDIASGVIRDAIYGFFY